MPPSTPDPRRSLRVTALAAALGAAALLGAGAASAAGPAPPATPAATPAKATPRTAPPAPSVRRSRLRQKQAPDGRIFVQGRGGTLFDGRMVVYGQLLGRRVILQVTDRNGDAQVIMAGDPAPVRRVKGVRTFRVATPGRFVVSGSGIRVELRADNLAVSAAGSGMARLSGAGRYWLNDRGPLAWSWRAVNLQQTPVEATPAQGRRAAPVTAVVGVVAARTPSPPPPALVAEPVPVEPVPPAPAVPAPAVPDAEN